MDALYEIYAFNIFILNCGLQLLIIFLLYLTFLFADLWYLYAAARVK